MAVLRQTLMDKVKHFINLDTERNYENKQIKKNNVRQSGAFTNLKFFKSTSTIQLYKTLVILKFIEQIRDGMENHLKVSERKLL